MQHAANIWPTVEQWAVENNYELETLGESARLYARISKDTSSKISVAITQVGADVRASAWYSDALRDELEIDSPSLYSLLPRKEALSEIQGLLAALGDIPPSKTQTKNKQNMAFNLGRSIRKLSGKK